MCIFTGLGCIRIISIDNNIIGTMVKGGFTSKSQCRIVVVSYRITRYLKIPVLICTSIHLLTFSPA